MKPLILLICLGTIGCSSIHQLGQIKKRTATDSAPSRNISTVENLSKCDIALIRDGMLWVGKGDGSNLIPIAKNASAIAWSPDGKSLAYRHGKKISIYDLGARRTRLLANDVPFHDICETVTSQLSFDPFYKRIIVSAGPGLRTYCVSDKKWGEVADILHTPFPGWQEGSPCWSPSGKLLAFTRNGDVWIAQRDLIAHQQRKAEMGAYFDETGDTSFYYDNANRLAAVAFYNDGEIGVSARTPYWVDGFSWSKDENSLIFHYQRLSGSGVSEIGIIQLSKVEDGNPRNAFGSGFEAKVNWLKTEPYAELFEPGVSPSGGHLTFLSRATPEETDDLNLIVAEFDLSHQKILIRKVDGYAWRPTQVSPN